VSLLFGWAGWDHPEQGAVLVSLVESRSSEDGWDTPRLTGLLAGLLAGLLEVMPWVRQWHGEVAEGHDQSWAHAYDGYLTAQHLVARAPEVLVDGCGAWQHQAYGVRRAALRALGEWLLTALVAFVLMEIAAQVLPGHWLTLPVIAASIGAATLGKLSYSLEKAALRRARSRRRPGGA
jgi:hypothetical protein